MEWALENSSKKDGAMGNVLGYIFYFRKNRGKKVWGATIYRKL